ncbi:hypothetical protein [Streptomyces sp. NPDC085932]|uniref:hypothetical protein n=1 Tax=Streptomyces sp. NPDC085932 TaxID=3365741 RepID=UPI0037D52275
MTRGASAGAAEITLTHGDDGEFSLSAVLSPVLGGVDQRTAESLRTTKQPK